MTEPQSSERFASPDPAHKSYRGAGVTVLMVAGLAISFALFTWAKIWFIPPVLPYTPLVYLLVWLPLLAFVDPKKRIGASLWRLVILFAILILPCCCVLYAPSSGVGIVFEAWTMECVERETGDSDVTVFCRSSSYLMEFTGVKGLPLLRLESLEGFDSVEPPPLPSE